jgi:hypothetical protein
MISENSNLSNKKIRSISNFSVIPEYPSNQAEVIYNILQKKLSKTQVDYENLKKQNDNRKFKHSFTLEIINDCETKPIINFSFNKTEEL